MKLSIFAIVLGTTIAYLLPTLASANNFSIKNNTKFDSAFIINNGKCSSAELGRRGVTHPDDINFIDESIIKSLCDQNNNRTNKQENCLMHIYMTKNCNSQVVATVTIDMEKGILSVENKGVEGFFAAKKLNFQLLIDGGPEKSRLYTVEK